MLLLPPRCLKLRKSQHRPDQRKEAMLITLKGSKNRNRFYGLSGPGSDFNELSGTTGDFTVSNYYPALGLFNFHSRSLGVSNSGTGITFSLKSDGILNDSSGSLYTGWDPAEKEILAGAQGAWAGWYPVLLYGAELQTPAPALGSYVKSSVYGGVWLPFDFSAGIISQALSFQGLLIMGSMLYPISGSFSAFQGSVEWDLNRKSSRRDLIPPLGNGISGMWYHGINPQNYNFLFGEYRVYLPGLLKNHGLKLLIQADYNLEQAGAGRKPVEVPRGLDPDDYEVPLFLNSSINYILPLMYPELSIGSLIYIPRLYMNCFLDTAYIPGEGLASNDRDGILHGFPSYCSLLSVQGRVPAYLQYDRRQNPH